MKKIESFFIFCFFTLLFSSCTTDFEVAAPYKETMVIYGLLNPADDIQHIRISKAYLGEGNSLTMAQERDSINYADILDVKLERIFNGVVVQTSMLYRDTTIPKNDGVFHYPYQALYSGTDSIRVDSKYRISVLNRQTGLTATAETKVVGDIRVDHPSPSAVNFNFTLPNMYTADFFAAQNGYTYNMIIRFNYKDVNLSTLDTSYHHVDWFFDDQPVGTNEPKIAYQLYRPDLYRIVGNGVPVVDTNVIQRRFGSPPINFIFNGSTEDFYTYQQLIMPSEGVVQDRPLFTNVENGIGLFTSRYVKTLHYNFDGVSRAAFDTSIYTKHLHFQ